MRQGGPDNRNQVDASVSECAFSKRRFHSVLYTQQHSHQPECKNLAFETWIDLTATVCACIEGYMCLLVCFL